MVQLAWLSIYASGSLALILMTEDGPLLPVGVMPWIYLFLLLFSAVVNYGISLMLSRPGSGGRWLVIGILFNLGYSHPINFALPDGISATIDKNNVVKLSGIDKELLGRTAASIRQLRPPEPYKGKGIRFKGEQIKLKAGKRVGA